MTVSALAGKSAPKEMLVNVPRLISAYYTESPDPDDPSQGVSFGTSGHRGSSLKNTFNEAHILAVCQATAELRRETGVTGPMFLGMDTHALSEPALRTAVEVFAANDVELMIQDGLGYTPTPVVSHAIIAWNRAHADKADGVIITPSHNPPEDGGIKYNPPEGGPASPEITGRIQKRANELIRGGNKDVRRTPFARALASDTTHPYDYVLPYVRDLANIVDMRAIAGATLRIGVDPMGGSGVAFWEPIADIHGLELHVVNPYVDPTFSFMTLDWDGKIRMDCSSPYAMASLLEHKDAYDVAFGNDTDYDRHGIVTPDGLMNPNAYLAVAARYLMTTRKNWSPDAAVGKTLVSSSIIDRMAAAIGREIYEVPVGFKWFVDGLTSGTLGFGGEESAGASFLRTDGTTWTTDKDGFIMDLLAAEMLAVTGKSPAVHYRELTERFGTPFYERIDAPATAEQKVRLKKLSPADVKAETLAGERVTGRLTTAPGNGAPIDGLKVTTENGWFAARPSGTEDVYKIYAESFQSVAHLRQIQKEAQEIVSATIG
ncbi:phosphoglucomutase (alpha-D-glucose-1,6-bisphosphate-dependent) [Synergistaceae bacterium OttesenSCG-928-I11]|nr:phosphoglucomutase (alpha-D-glucose-1,6-bisphosphate-dependent) [Synergistaceae bacterium OttesenSCG-928-I11]